MRKIVVLVLTICSFTLQAQEIDFGDVSKKELEEKVYPTDSLADAAYLFRYRKTYYEFNQNTGFTVVTEVHNRIKIYNKEGFEKGNISIRYYNPTDGKGESVSRVKGYTFNLENGKVKRSSLKNREIKEDQLSKYYMATKIAMPNIKEGSVIDIKYKLSSPYTQSIDVLEFQFDIPVKELDYTVDTPEFYRFGMKPRGYYMVNPIVSERSGTISSNQRVRASNRGGGLGGSTVTSNVRVNRTRLKYNTHQYKAKNVPALRSGEPFVRSIKNYRGAIKYEILSLNFPNQRPKIIANSWEKVTEQIFKSNNFGGQLGRTSFFEDDLKAAIADAATEEEKITAILQLVKSKVKWNSYYGKYTDSPIKKAYKEGSGNSAVINLLLTSMLREAGLDANPILTSTASNGVPFSPTLDGFNYVISGVNSGGKTILLDATEEHSYLNVLPSRVLNWRGRMINKDGVSSWVNLIPNEFASTDYNINVTMKDDASVEGMVRTKYDNLNALNFRKKNIVLKEEDIISKIEEDNSIEIQNFKIGNLEKLSKPVTRLYTFTSEDLVERISGKLYINPLIFFALKTNPFKVEDRQYPVDFGTPWSDKHTVVLEIPEGYKVEFVPETSAIGLPDGLGLFKFQILQGGNKLRIVSMLQFNKEMVVPKHYPALKEFFKKVVDKQSEKIVLVKA